MVGSLNTEALAAYLEKHREIRLLSEELESLKTEAAIGQSLKVRHELEAMMNDYDLTPEQVVEILCVFFGVAKPTAMDDAGLKVTDPRAVPKKSTLTPERSENPSSAGASEQRAERPGVDEHGHSSSAQDDGVAADADRGGSDSSGSGRKDAGSAEKTGVMPSMPVKSSGGGNRKATIRKRKSRKGQKRNEDSVNRAPSDAPALQSGDRDQRGEPSDQGTHANQSNKPATVPSGANVSGLEGGRRAGRPAKLYTNPHTGAQVKTRGANHRILNAWRVEYGKDEVERWWVYPAPP